MKAVLDDAAFGQLRVLLDAAAGLVFDDSRRDSLSYSVGERMTTTGVASVAAYLELLAAPGSAPEMQALLNEVTIQETHFFRNPPQFRALRQHVLPQLVRDAAAGRRRLRVWSAGCSTGEEPYSVAMLLRELLPVTDGWDIQVLATDISTRALDTARAGRYSARALAVADPADVARWFVHERDDFVVRPEVAELVEFRRHNLAGDPLPFGPDEPVDLILCRNVTIYFSRPTTRSLIRRFHGALRDGGYLFVGHSETLWQVNDEFLLVTLGDAFVYRKTPSGTAEGERRTVLPDRRVTDLGPPPGVPERRAARTDRRAGRRDPLARPRPRHARPDQHDGPVAPAPAGVALATSADPVDQVRSLLRNGDYEGAAELAAHAGESEPMRAEAHYLRGLALANLGRDAEALVSLRKSIYVDPTAGFAHFLLAGALARLGDRAAAARAYRAAAEALGRTPADSLAAELGGRSVNELINLCWHLSGVRRPQ